MYVEIPEDLTERTVILEFGADAYRFYRRGTQMFICNVCGADVCFFGAEYDVKARIAWNRRSETEKSK
jgi:hypothetical protein|nr:MAG TPA: co-chaperone HscB [Caudoviricetes sp.]